MKFLDKTVFDAAIERLNTVFDAFDNVVVSFSGGKDSALLLNLALYTLDLRGRREAERKIGLFHLDYEAQYTATTEFVEQTFSRLEGRVLPYWCCVPFKVTTCASMRQSHWRPWEDGKRPLWVREKPALALGRGDFAFYAPELWDYDFQERFSRWQHERTGAKKTPPTPRAIKRSATAWPFPSCAGLGKRSTTRSCIRPPPASYNTSSRIACARPIGRVRGLNPVGSLQIPW